MIRCYRDLIVWQKAMDLAVEVYRLSKVFPKDELYSLTNQLRRAVVSIASNIAEGNERDSKAEYLHFLSIAQGSLAETETQIELAVRLNFISKKDASDCENLQIEISKMLSSLHTKLRNKP